MRKRVLVIVDVSNIYYTVRKKFQARLDYRRFLSTVTKGASSYRAIAYGSEFENDPPSLFRRALESIGFETRFKTVKVYKKPDGTEAHKADCDVNIAVDAISLFDSFDTLVLASADGDMCPLIRYLQHKGKRCEVIGCFLSRELRETVDDWTEIGEALLEGQKV